MRLRLPSAQLCPAERRKAHCFCPFRDPERTTTQFPAASQSLVEVIESMAHFSFRSAVVSAFFLAATLIVSGCHGGQHPDNRMAVYSALDQNDLRSVTVSQDRGAGTITLSGIVGSADRRDKAEQLAKQAAPGYQIVDRIQVQSAGLQSQIKTAAQQAQLDSAIESKYKAALASDPKLKSQKIECYATNGTVTLRGRVRTREEWQQAEDLAKQLPDVQKVKNELRIAGGKSSNS